MRDWRQLRCLRHEGGAGTAWNIANRATSSPLSRSCTPVEAGAPERFRQLASGHLNVGIGRASLVPPEVISELFRPDPLGRLVPEGHRLAASQGVPVAKPAPQLAPSRRSCAGVVGAA